MTNEKDISVGATVLQSVREMKAGIKARKRAISICSALIGFAPSRINRCLLFKRTQLSSV